VLARACRSGAARTLAAALSVLALTACGGTSVTELSAPSAVRCQISLGSAAANVPAAGSQLNVSVVAARDCTWSSQSGVSWIQVSPASGQGEASLAVTVSANTATSARTGQVSVNGQPFQVTQDAAAGPPPPPCSYSLSPTSRNVSDNSGTATVQLTTGSTCSWTASSTVSWITFESPTSGTGSATIRYRFAQNQSDDPRTGFVVVAGRIHTVRQDGD
jgi:hypothetical protein